MRFFFEGVSPKPPVPPQSCNERAAHFLSFIYGMNKPANPHTVTLHRSDEDLAHSLRAALLVWDRVSPSPQRSYRLSNQFGYRVLAIGYAEIDQGALVSRVMSWISFCPKEPLAISL